MRALALLLLPLASCALEPASPSETVCGWVEVETTTLPEPRAGGCWVAAPGPNAAATAPGTHACDVERRPLVAEPGERVALWARVGALSGVVVRWRAIADCP